MSKHLMSAEEVDALGMKLLKLFDMDKLNVTRIGIEVICLKFLRHSGYLK